jgi:23S rRNA-/tRNA-specific pseudouridylate synthase
MPSGKREGIDGSGPIGAAVVAGYNQTVTGRIENKILGAWNSRNLLTVRWRSRRQGRTACREKRRYRYEDEKELASHTLNTGKGC